MKVLHISSMAGVAEILSKEMGDSLVLQLRVLDKYGFGDFYNQTFYFKDPNEMVEHAKFIQDQYDYIVIHDAVELFDEFPYDKSVMYFHGSKLRSMGSYDDVAFVSTPDLLEYCPRGIYIPQPIDLEHFKPNGKQYIFDKGCFNRGYNFDFIYNEFKKKYNDFVFYFKTSDDWVEYKEMPNKLCEFKDYIEGKYTYDKPPKLLPSTQWSCTALQAAACGCNVIHLDGTILPKSLLKVHDSKVVAEKFKACLEVLKTLKNSEM